MKFAEKLTSRNRWQPGNGRPATIVCIGDSVTQGCFEVFLNEKGGVDTAFRPDMSYSARLSTRLRLLCPASGVSVINAGISGDNAPGGAARFERDALSYHPDLVVVAFGLNDSCHPDPEKGVKLYADSLRSMLAAARDAGVEAILLTPNRMCGYVSNKIPEELLRKIADQCSHVQKDGVLDRYIRTARDVAAEFNVPVADAYARWCALENAGVDTTALLANHINHPVSAMHDIFTEELVRAIFEK